MAIYNFSKAWVGDTEKLKKSEQGDNSDHDHKENNRNIHITVIIFKKLGGALLVIIFFCSAMKC